MITVIKNTDWNNYTSPVSLADVAEGSTLVAIIGQSADITKTYAVSDNVNGAWQELVSSGTKHQCRIFCFVGAQAGTTTVTVSQAGEGSANFMLQLVELSPCVASVTGSWSTNPGYSHYCADVDGLTTEGPSLIISAVVLMTDGGTVTGAGSPVGVPLYVSSTRYSQYHYNENGFTNFRPRINSSVSRTAFNTSAAFVLEATGPTAPINTLAPSLTVDGNTVTGAIGGWTSPEGSGELASGSYQWEIRSAVDDGSVISGSGDTVGPETLAAGTYYLWVQCTNDVGSTTAISSTVEVVAAADETPPALVSATIDALGQSLILSFDEIVSGNTGITLTADGSSVSATYTGGSGTDTLTYTLSRTVWETESLTLQYAAGDIADLAGNPLGDLADYEITNASEQELDESEPTPVNVTINAQGTLLSIVFDRAVSGTSGVSVETSGEPFTLSYASGENTNTLSWGTSRPVHYSESLLLDYSDGDVQGENGQPLSPFQGLVTNSSLVGATQGVSVASVFSSGIVRV